ncbi:iron ABC transporter permease [Glaciihabitans sp. dw_435]|uniref:FecCD family ABC transporter permease n=1 Tax=Glaciihabitans sp. dw_435 TaxID=2720081 RepID=UPI0027DE876B|nr:iron ABC transporter permease [Glaciihabitans sp. dw_435]
MIALPTDRRTSPPTRQHAPTALLYGGGLVAVLAVVAASLLVGSRALDPATVWQALWSAGNAEAHAIVVGQRLPRTLLGLVGGGALALAGAMIQGHTRNPLADPGLLGVTAGSSLAVVTAIAVFGLTTPAGYLWFAFAGAAAGTAIVTAIATAAGRRRDASPASLVLAGAAVSAFLSAATGVVLLLDSSALDLYRFWTVGSLAGGRSLSVLTPVLPFVVAGAVVALAQSRVLDVLALGDDVARSLGRRMVPTRIAGLAAVTLLVGSATSLVGSLGFIGLIAPHAVRWFTGSGYRLLLPMSLISGAVVTVFADIIGRLVVMPAELPVGVVLGVVGGPAFLVIIARMRRSRS